MQQCILKQNSEPFTRNAVTGDDGYQKFIALK